jgi:RimJ/RimL family protein N-acetyltransferase
MFARTERLMLRPGWVEDAPALASAIDHSSIVANLGWSRWPLNGDDAERWLRHNRDAGLPRLLVLSRTDGAPELVGGVGLHRTADNSVELDFWTRHDRRGAGFATEAAKAMLNIAQCLRLRELFACAFGDRGGAARVLEKLGFTSAGTVMRRTSGGQAVIPATLLVRRVPVECDAVPLLAA